MKQRYLDQTHYRTGCAWARAFRYD
ncbi:unnamed protein product [Leptidea sinapis]|uniref:Uncharacterized protein n=1 Tax=Leptidea sinapis TaxID=189913 RepID=A0A5E4QC55_9NEOP|nr:unnamed protein product [Leptidea sinapis]